MREAIYDGLRRISSYKLRQWFKRQAWFLPLCRAIFGNSVYSEGYYRDVERIEEASMPEIAAWIRNSLRPKRVIDVGCGPGHLMEALTNLGIKTCGVDLSNAALNITKRKGLNTSRFDLTQKETRLPDCPFDVVISCEVAEHLDERFAPTFVDHLTSAAPVVYLTAAEPNSAEGLGMYHVNEQPHSYWIELFKQRGFEFQSELAKDAAETFRQRGVISYLAKPLIFRRQREGVSYGPND